MAQSGNRVFAACAALSLLLWGGSVPLHCAALAAWVGGVTFGAGSLAGFALACVTRTRRPLLIYLWLILALGAFWPLYAQWPYADEWNVVAWPNAPPLVLSYFTFLRVGAFLFGFPGPFVRFGQHGPDPLPAQQSPSPDTNMQKEET